MFKAFHNFLEKDKNNKNKRTSLGPMASQPDSNKSHTNKIQDENHYMAKFRSKH
jgi:hypothetical protein